MGKAKAIDNTLVDAARHLCREVETLHFGPPTAFIYNPLRYAAEAHELYIRKYGTRSKKIIFLGMNPGPFGMAQTGVPFGEVAMVRDWLGVSAPVAKPVPEHPKRLVEGFSCTRSEVSGRRLWGLFRDRFGQPEAFFKDCFVANYCPLVFMETGGRNRTPDKLSACEMQALYTLCDQHLRAIAVALQAEWVIGIGAFAEKRAQEALGDLPLRIGRILHPSPASPAANRDWAGQATRQLEALGIWDASTAS